METFQREKYWSYGGLEAALEFWQRGSTKNNEEKVIVTEKNFEMIEENFILKFIKLIIDCDFNTNDLRCISARIFICNPE